MLSPLVVFGLDGTLSLFAGAIALGIVHGAEPGHGWPVAATYALDRNQRWLHGFVASTLLGLGHLVSSIAVVVVFFLATDYFGVTQLGWIRYVAGVLLIGLGVREYRHGHAHDHSTGEDHSHDDDGHVHDHESHSHDHGQEDHPHESESSHDLEHRSGHGHDREHRSTDDLDRQGLRGIVGTAFVLGFAHEEEFEIIGLCLGSSYCLELMFVYALAVLVALVVLTLLLVAGFEHYGECVEEYTEHLPTISAVVLVALGFGFIFGVV